jgi:hypothetical protein
MMFTTYLLYVAISVCATIWVGRSLHRNGRVFLVENFAGREQLADSVNHLLLVGFYLVNIGFVSLALKYGAKPQTLVGVVEFLSTKIGLVIVLLGLMHFYNMRMLVRFRDSSLFQALVPRAPVARASTAS